MKKTIFLLSTAIIGISFFLIQSCKKEQSEENPQVSVSDKALENKILSNIEEFQNYKNGLFLKSGEVVPLEEAIAYIDETFNFTYSFPLTDYSVMHWDSSYIDIPLTVEHKVFKYCDLYASYDLAVETIRELFQNYQEEDKRIVGLQVEDAGFRPEIFSERIRLISQIISGTKLDVSFDDDWYFAKNSFRCDGTLPPGATGPIGAANIIENQTNFVFRSCPPPGYRYYFVGPPVVYTPQYFQYPNGSNPDNFEDYFIFYGNESVPGWVSGMGGTKCINGGTGDTEMEFYINGMIEMVVPDLRDKPQSSGKSFEVCTVNSSESFYPNIVKHNPFVIFRQMFIAVGPSPYPISIE